MPHEPIVLAADGSWDQNKGLLVYELNRVCSNVHDLRGEIQAHNMLTREQVTRDLKDAVATTDAKFKRVEDGITTNTVRLAVLETKALLFGFIGAALGTGLINFVFWKATH